MTSGKTRGRRATFILGRSALLAFVAACVFVPVVAAAVGGFDHGSTASQPTACAQSTAPCAVAASPLPAALHGMQDQPPSETIFGRIGRAPVAWLRGGEPARAIVLALILGALCAWYLRRRQRV